VIETGDEDVSGVLKYIVATSSSSRSHKTSPIWNYFANFDPCHHPNKKQDRICLVCRDIGVDKSICVGRDYSNTPLISHLQCMHKDKYKEFLALKEDQKPSKSQFSQSTISTHFLKLGDVKDKFKHKFARWVVEDSMPLTM